MRFLFHAEFRYFDIDAIKSKHALHPTCSLLKNEDEFIHIISWSDIEILQFSVLEIE